MMKTRYIFVVIGMLIIIHLLMVIPAFQNPSRVLTRDSSDYLDLARTLIATGRYAGTEYPGIDLKRPPAYPLLLVIGLWVGNGEVGVISLIQVLLLFATAWLLYSIFSLGGYHKAGLAAVIIYMLNPNAAFWSIEVMTETLAGFLLALGSFCLVRYWISNRKVWLLAAGLSFSIGALTRPILYPLGISLAVALFLLEWWRTHRPIRSFTAAIIFTIGVLGLVIPWQFRNLAVNKQFTLSEVGESTFRDWMVAQTLASAKGISRDEASAMIANAPSPMQYSIDVIRQYPLIFVKEQGRGILRSLLGAEYGTWAKVLGGEEVATTGVLSAFLDQRSLSGIFSSLTLLVNNPWFWLGIYAILFDLVLYAASLVGIISTLKQHHQEREISLALVLVLVLVYLLIIPGAAGESRFRAPADPLLAVTASLAFKPK